MVLNKVSSMGYFGGVAKVSRGPWFREFWVEDDGLEWYYSTLNTDGTQVYLLSNNMTLKDREQMSHLYSTMNRNNKISWFVGMWLGFETVTKVQYFKKMALGWRALSFFGVSFLFNNIFMNYSSQSYAPLFSAYLRKYQSKVTSNLFEINDEKKAYFYIDTSEYMNYTNADLSDEYHVHHGP